MKKVIIIPAAFLFVSGLILHGCGRQQKPVDAEIIQPTAAQLIQKGGYLVTIMGCNDCHSPKKTGPQGPLLIPELMLSGYPAGRPLLAIELQAIKKGWILLNEDLTAAAGPWGVSFSANLTSDQSGIGNWTEENFKRAIKGGKYKGLEGSRTLLPPMPWTNFADITDEDVKSIFAYLMSTNPVRNAVPPAIPPEEIK